MMCPRKKILRALSDREIGESLEKKLHQHIAGCKPCQSRLVLIRAEGEWLKEMVGSLDPEEPLPLPPLIVPKPMDSRKIPLWRRSLLVPAPVMMMLLVVFLALAASLIRQSQRSRRFEVAQDMPQPPATLVVSVSGVHQSFDLTFDAGRVSVPDHPRIFVVKEEAHEQKI